MGEFGDEIGGRVAAVGFCAGDGGESFSEKAIARENRDGFAENAVIGGPTAPKIIVVHAGEIVVNEGVGVNAFDGASGGNCKGLFSPNGSSGSEAEDRAKAFAPCEKTIAHGAVNEGWIGLGGDELIEGFFDQGKAGFPEGLRVHRGEI